MAFIAAQLKLRGRINRRDIMEKFEVSAPQAAADFRQFEKVHPGAMRYDASLKTYVPSRARKRDQYVIEGPWKLRDFDGCECGDYRHQHVDGVGRCTLGSLCTPSHCQKFRLSTTATEIPKPYAVPLQHEVSND